MNTVTLGGKPRSMAEPPLGQLRRILKIYRALVAAQGDDDAAADRRLSLVQRLLGECFPAQRLGAITGDEMSAFLNALPYLCGLERVQPGAADHDTDDDQAFGNVYAHLIASFGWDYDTIDSHITLSKLKDMAYYMKRNPPTHQLVAAYLGYHYETPAEKLRRFFLAAKARA